MMTPNTPLFVKTHEFLVWVLRHTQRFPKHLRYSFTSRLESAGFDFQEAILMANAVRGRDRMSWLDSADGRLLCFRALLRLTVDLELLSSRQVQYAVERMDELGRLLGAWKKGTDR